MIRFALRGLLGRKLRTALTAIAIVLGVAMVSGTYVLTDSIDQAFDTIFSDIRQGSNAVISGKSAVDITEGGGSTTPTFAESLLATVRGLQGVAQAEGSVDSDATQLIGDDGKAVVYGGAPNLGFSISAGDSVFNPLELVDGSWPGPDQVVIDETTAKKEGFEVGETVGVQAHGPVERVRVSGIVKFKSSVSFGGATLAGFDLATAQRLFGKVGRLDEIAIASRSGVPDAELVQQVSAVLPPGTQVRSGRAQAREDAADTSEFIGFLQKFLLAFGGVALFVGSFVIANSLSITIAQRTREFATLRTIGASRRQVLGSIVLESLVVGVLASVIGLFSGLLLATGLFELFDAVGFTLPNSGLVFENRTIVVALLVGILVTLAASLRPAVRATRVPPIAAVREGATLPESRFARFRTPASVLFTALGFGMLLWGLFGASGTTAVLLFMLLGALVVFLGVALFSVRLVQPLARLLSPVARWVVFVFTALAWPLWLLPYWLLRHGAFGPGSVGTRVAAFAGGAVLNPLLLLVAVAMWLRASLTSWEPEWPMEFPGVVPDAVTAETGGHNTRRNPQRTSSTASALMIGLALVTLVAVLAAGIVQTFKGAVDDLWRNADYAITAQNNFSPIPVSAAEAVAMAPGVTAVGNVRTGEVGAYGKTIFGTAVDPPTSEMFSLDWKVGSDRLLATLGADGAFVDLDYAKAHDLQQGSLLTLTFPDGAVKTFTVQGIFDPPSGGSPFGRVTISAQAWDAVVEQPRNLYSFVLTQGGLTDANQQALDRALADFPNAKAQTRQQFIDNQIAGLSAVLNILYVLLALSVVVSLFGIVNTLVLTVFERTREIGMLRAIGMTRRQVRRMIRHESVITALIGAAIGIVLGVVLAALLIVRVDFIDFSFPLGQLVVFAVAAVLVGLLAAVFPARRAAKLNPLEALHYE
ncbi:MAG: ABC transporter permease [Thermoleophilia bacterium]|nr:ABC transporter permease [Thermoleophilia bacterium]